MFAVEPIRLGADGSTLQSQLATDIEVTRERLRGLDTSHHNSHNSLGALSSLSEAYAAFWHDDSEFSKVGKEFFLFEDRAVSWVNGGPSSSIPPNKTAIDITCHSIRRHNESGPPLVQLCTPGGAGPLESIPPASSASKGLAGHVLQHHPQYGVIYCSHGRTD